MWPVTPTETLILQLDEARTVWYPSPGTPTNLKLYVNDVSPDENSVAAQFTEPTYTGYADVPLVMNNASVNDQGVVGSQSNLCSFRVTSTGGTDLVYGFFVVTDGGILVSATRFETPQPMQVVNDVIVGVWRVANPPSNYGWISVE